MSTSSLPESYHPCPICNARSLLIVDFDSGLPILSPSHTPMYFCPHHLEAFWEGKQVESTPVNPLDVFPAVEDLDEEE
jgi:hypothetical protein